jgi:glucose/arabinose dehydrogenase
MREPGGSAERSLRSRSGAPTSVRRPESRDRRLLGGLTAGVLTVTGCGAGGSDSESAKPDVTTATIIDERVDASSSPTTETSGSGTAASGTGTSDGATSSTTLKLTPAPNADLPTDAPSSEPVPVTTAPGPLTTPAVRLLDVATFEQPLEAAVRPGDGRLFVVEQGGKIIAIDDESSTTVLDLLGVDGVTLSRDSEQGLLGLAFHAERDLAYVNYTNGDGDTVVAEFAIDPTDATVDSSSYREVLKVDQPFANHNGGELVFGPDGFLYIGLGDGGSADDPNRSALDLSERLGKILRIDPVATPDGAFSVPSDNPFVEVEGADPTIWSRGLRNPWRFSFDSLTGDLWIADVGQNRFEEVNLALATNGTGAGQGTSFGWSAFEAADRFNDDQSADNHALPVVTYAHENGNCSVSGGVVARGSTYRALNGWYIYGDYCTGTVWGLDTTSVTITPDGPTGDPVIVELATVPALAAVVEGPDGDIYAISNEGPVYRLIPS